MLSLTSELSCSCYSNVLYYSIVIFSIDTVFMIAMKKYTQEKQCRGDNSKKVK